MDAMPSWNIHTAHVERLLAQEDAAALGIRDANEFLMGNLVPDIYVGWMVPDVSHKIDYRKTHFAGLGHVPEPNYEAFFKRFAVPSADADGRVPDVVLGAWTHLVADHIYNAHFNRLLARRHLLPSSQIRDRKQADFATYGRTLDISLVPQPTPQLLAACAAFPQYAIAERDARATCEVMGRIVADNARLHVEKPTYDLLDDDYFARVSGEVDATMREALREYASGRADWGRLRP